MDTNPPLLLHNWKGLLQDDHVEHKFGTIIHNFGIAIIQLGVGDIRLVDCNIKMKDFADQLQDVQLEFAPRLDVFENNQPRFLRASPH